MREGGVVGDFMVDLYYDLSKFHLYKTLIFTMWVFILTFFRQNVSTRLSVLRSLWKHRDIALSLNNLHALVTRGDELGIFSVWNCYVYVNYSGREKQNEPLMDFIQRYLTEDDGSDLRPTRYSIWCTPEPIFISMKKLEKRKADRVIETTAQSLNTEKCELSFSVFKIHWEQARDMEMDPIA